jgi:hypothetical protein
MTATRIRSCPPATEPAHPKTPSIPPVASTWATQPPGHNPRRTYERDHLEGWFIPIRTDLHDLRREIESVRATAQSAAAEALANIEEKVTKRTAELNANQTLDLRWAIIGLFISAFGTWLQYWA